MRSLDLFAVQKTINHQGKRIAYDVNGDGKPLVLLHGFGLDSSMWDSMLPLLSKQFKVITPDTPGAGESEVLDGEPSLEALADVVAAVIKEESNAPCSVIGHSMGGYTALALAERHAQLINGFGLFHSHPFPDDEAKKEKRDKDTEFIKRMGSGEYIKLLIPALFGENYKKQQSEELNALVARYQTLSPQGLTYALQAMKNRIDRSQVVSSSTRPFLLIAGVEDNVVNMDTVNMMYKMPQYTFGLFIREAAHMGMIEAPEACAKHVINWMNTL